MEINIVNILRLTKNSAFLGGNGGEVYLSPLNSHFIGSTQKKLYFYQSYLCTKFNRAKDFIRYLY